MNATKKVTNTCRRVQRAVVIRDSGVESGSYGWSMKKRGRPPKNGVVEAFCFGRALMIIHAYSKARDAGQKHSCAVRETVESVRQLDPKMPVSETAVKRVLAEFMPRDSQVALRVDYSILEGDDAAERRRFHAEMLAFAGNRISTELTDQDQRRPLKAFKFGFGIRPIYPRHNAKSPKA
jgi:hypothetical protein